MVRMCILIIKYSTKLVKKINKGNVHVKNPKILALLPVPHYPSFYFFFFLNQIYYRKSESE